MIHVRLLLMIVLVGLVALVAPAQNFGGNQPGKWGQINTNEVKVLFPKGMDSVANRVASIALALQQQPRPAYRQQKINIVLQPNTTISNAYVTLAPYYSEFYLTAPQNPFELGSLSWADNLVIHEWRHVQQYNYFNRGLAKFSTVFLGQEGRAVLNAAAVPDWFFEGDAVLNETKYSAQGRGRLPLSFSGYKSLFMDGRRYSFMKLRNGSLKDMVPNHYDLGYLLVAYGAEKYGSDFWNKVTADAAAFKPLVYPLQGAIKKHTGISYQQFVDEALNYYQKQWKQETVENDVAWVTHPTKTKTDYLYPYANGKGGVIAVKESTTRIPTFYNIGADGTEERIALQGVTLDKYFSFRNDRIVFAGYGVSPRWANKQYSNVYLLDVTTKRLKKVTSMGRYFSPDISADGKTIVAVEMPPQQTSRLVLMDDEGVTDTYITAATGEIFSQPKFSEDATGIYVPVRNGAGHMSIRKYTLNKNGSFETIVPFGNYVIGYPTVNGDTLLFTATTHTSDDVYAWVGKSRQLYHIAKYPTGLYQSALVNGQLVSAAFTASGYRLGKVATQWEKVSAPPVVENLYVSKALESNTTLANIPMQRFSYKKYSKLTNPFNFHSWRPYYDQPEFSFTVYGQNVLNTIATQLAYIYNENERTHAAAGTFIFGGTALQPFATVKHTWDRSFVYRPDTIPTWNELEYGIGVQLPFNLTGGRTYKYLNLAASFRAVDLTLTGRFKNIFRTNDINYLLVSASYTVQLPKASQQIFPRFALAASAQLRTGLNKTANQFLANGSVYLPGISRKHSTVVSFAYQGRDTMQQYGYTNNFPYPRGFDGGYNLPRMWKVGFNYHFPLWHPDWGVGNLLYIQRIRANAFTDYAQLQSLRTGALYAFQSAGGEVFFDTKFWNQLPVSFGVRYNYQVTADVGGVPFNQWEIIVPVGLIR